MQMAMQRVRATWLTALGLLTFAVFSTLALAPRAAEAGSGGRIFVSDAPYGSFASEKDMSAAIKRQSKTAFKGDGSWNLNFMVFLNAAPGADKINIVYYDVSKKKEQVNFAEVGVKPDQKIVQLNDQTISKDLGFVKGHKYEVRATRLIGGKEKVYAKTVITLK
jgi:hypothetical protein